MIGKLKKRKRLRVHGFLARKNTVDGQKVLRARRRKGRHVLTVSYLNRYKNIRGKSTEKVVLRLKPNHTSPQILTF